MRLCRVCAGAVCALTLSTAEAYSYRADFSVTDGAQWAPSIDKRQDTAYSHGHSEVADGVYKILVSGARHYFSTPRLADFTLKTDWGYERVTADGADLGFRLRFRDDRCVDDGHELKVWWTSKGRFIAALDGREVYACDEQQPVKTFVTNLQVSVTGQRARADIAGHAFSFDVPGSVVPGYVSMDILPVSATCMTLSSLSLDSPEEPARTQLGQWRFVLPNKMGFTLPPVYDVTLWRYASGETLMEATLSGTQLSRPEKRLETGGGEWAGFLERLTTPYVRVEDVRTGRSRTLPFWNGMRQLYDTIMHRKPYGEARLLPEVPWPAKMSVVLRDFPEDFRLAAGFEAAVATPWRFAAQGKWEQVRDRKGEVLYDGPALGDGRIAVKAVSPDDKRIVSKIPQTLPNAEAALRHAREQHYFYESEKVTFDVTAFADARDYGEGEVDVGFSFTDVFGERELFGQDVKLQGTDVLPGNVRVVRFRVSLGDTPSCGVWHLNADVYVDGVRKERNRTVFEILSDDPNGPCPPLASGLPEFVSMPNELKYLESDAFDPWSERGGVSHYYTTINRYPAVANATSLWDVLPLYRRRWFCWSWNRNTSETDIRNDFNRALMRHADVFGGDDNGTPLHERFDLSYNESYLKEQLRILRDYVAERRPPLKKLTVAELDGRLKAGGKALSADELKEIVETCWNDFVRYARARIDRYTADFDDYVFSVNPKAGRGG